MTGEGAVAVRGVAKVYQGGVEALHEVDLDVPRGELTTLLGPSGCGKTTLLKIIAGLIEPSAGEIRVGGRKVRGRGPSAPSSSRTSRSCRGRPCCATSPSGWSCGGCLETSGSRSRAAASRRSGSRASSTATRTSSPGACASGSGSPVRSRSMLTSCSWTSPSPRSTSRPGASSRKIVRPALERGGDFERIRREQAYLDCIDEIWAVLKRYLED